MFDGCTLRPTGLSTIVERFGSRAVAESLRSRCTDFMRMMSAELRYGSVSGGVGLVPELDVAVAVSASVSMHPYALLAGTYLVTVAQLPVSSEANTADAVQR